MTCSKSIGIEKGKPLGPDAKTKSILEDAAREAHALIEMRYEAVFVPPFNEGTHWALPASAEVTEGMPNFFAKPDSYPTDGRGVTYSMAYFKCSSIWASAGQFYLMTINDKDGRRFDGKSTDYRLDRAGECTCQAVQSATAYDRATHALIRYQKWASRGSNTLGIQKNGDGSVDIYFGPKAPEGKESNWVPTDADGSLRFSSASTAGKTAL